MELPTYFTDMLSEIRPTQSLVQECISAHTELREFLLADPDIKDHLVTTFLQGSYIRNTLVRPIEGTKADVDVVIVTDLDPKSWSPNRVQSEFCKVLDKHSKYRGHYRRQGRSIGVSLDSVDLDIVITAAPSESAKAFAKSVALASQYPITSLADLEVRLGLPQRDQNWKNEPLLIPDRDANQWEPTDPLTQIEWTHQKNKATNGHYVNVVKVIKWWWAQQRKGKTGYPKGYLIERLVGLHCPDGITTVAEGVVATLEAIRGSYAGEVELGRTPFIPDTGIPSNNVFKRIKPDAFRAFHQLVGPAAKSAREALEASDVGASALKWRGLFGIAFPLANGGGASNSSTQFPRPNRPANPRKADFA